ncbi:MAG: isochorismate synthase [Acidimicrobiales bacterium]
MTDAATLTATTERSDARRSLTTLPTTMFLSPRRELRGWGEALRIELPAPWVDHLDLVTDALAAIAATSELGDVPGSGPVAFAALPFDRTAPATFVVPAVLRGSTADGAHWITTVSPPSPGSPEPAPDSASASDDGGVSPSPSEMTIRSVIAADTWCDLVAEATKRIAAGDLDKVVLARELVVTADRPFDAHVLADRLAHAHPHAFRFDVDGFVGASPELLVSRFGDVVRAHPMAGTTPRTGDQDVDGRQAAELLHSHKNRDEHQITIDMVLDTLLEWTSFVDAEPVPSVVAAGSVQHLATMVEGRLSEPAASVLELVRSLHPTPAVGGFPREAALELIEELEPDTRGRYAGPVGWVDASGNGAWAVGLRSVSVDGATARLFAGVGVVADSDPESELAETRAKFAATLGSITRL